MQVFISSLLGGVLGILFLIPFRKYFVSDMHGKYPLPRSNRYYTGAGVRRKERQPGQTAVDGGNDRWIV